jgi:hypothetical protein
MKAQQARLIEYCKLEKKKYEEMLDLTRVGSAEGLGVGTGVGPNVEAQKV